MEILEIYCARPIFKPIQQLLDWYGILTTLIETQRNVL